MDYLLGPQAKIVLSLKEGNGFSFPSSGIIAAATLKGITLETNEFQPTTRPQFNSELIWEISTKYLRKLRSSNTALKLQFFSLLSKSGQSRKRDRIGYILLNLKEAQIIKGTGLNVLESWYRLLDLKNIFQNYKPEVLLKFEVLESSLPMNFAQIDSCKDEKELGRNGGEGDYVHIGRTSPELLKPLQIGPPLLCTEHYELSISFFSVENLHHIIPLEKIEQPIKIHFAIFGLSLWTNDLSSLQQATHTERIAFQIWSKSEFLSAYFRQFESLVLTLYSDDILGVAQLNLHHLANVSTRKNAAINSLITIKPASGDESVTDMLPTLQVGVNLLHRNDIIVMKLDQESQTTAQLPRTIDAVTNTDIPEQHFSSRNEKSQPFDQFIAKENSYPLEEPGSESVSNRSMKISEKASNSKRAQKGPFIEQADFVLRSPPPPTFRMSNASANHTADYSKDYIRDAALRACEELEDWKEKQQEMFEYELKRKSERRLKKLSSEWLKHKQTLEDDLNKKIEECKNLKEKLTLALQDLNQRTELVAEKEHELQVAKDELDRKYSQKFHELRNASKLHEYDMEDRINEVKSENIELMRKLEESRKEILRLQDAMLHHNSPVLTKEEVNNLMSEMRAVEEKLGKALESKAFFKEQWGKAVRELHRMKEEEQQHLRLQIQKNKQELQTLGLVQEISQEVGEMKKDQFAIKNIRNDLSNFISSGDPNLAVNYFSGT